MNCERDTVGEIWLKCDVAREVLVSSPPPQAGRLSPETIAAPTTAICLHPPKLIEYSEENNGLRLNPLDQRPGTEAAAAAHRHQAHLLVGALHLVPEGGAGPGEPERVAEGDRAAVDVDAIHVRFELAAPGADDGGEGLVDLDQV